MSFEQELQKYHITLLCLQSYQKKSSFFFNNEKQLNFYLFIKAIKFLKLEPWPFSLLILLFALPAIAIAAVDGCLISSRVLQGSYSLRPFQAWSQFVSVFGDTDFAPG